MTRGWDERIYSAVICLYPVDFRKEYGGSMRLLFADLKHDPDVSRIDLAAVVLRDAFRGFISRMPGRALTRHSVVFGCAVLAIWITCRAYHPGAHIGVPLVASPFLVFVLAGFVGARTTGTFMGGIESGLITGLISAITVPGEYLVFHAFPFHDLRSFTAAMAMTVGFCMAATLVGATVARLGDIPERIQCSLHAFADALQVRS